MTPSKVVTAICGTCSVAVECVLFVPGVDLSYVSPMAIEDHEDAYGHVPEAYEFVVMIPHRADRRAA